MPSYHHQHHDRGGHGGDDRGGDDRGGDGHGGDGHGPHPGPSHRPSYRPTLAPHRRPPVGLTPIEFEEWVLDTAIEELTGACDEWRECLFEDGQDSEGGHKSFERLQRADKSGNPTFSHDKSPDHPLNDLTKSYLEQCKRARHELIRPELRRQARRT